MQGKSNPEELVNTGHCYSLYKFTTQVHMKCQLTLFFMAYERAMPFVQYDYYILVIIFA